MKCIPLNFIVSKKFSINGRGLGPGILRFLRFFARPCIPCQWKNNNSGKEIPAMAAGWASSSDPRASRSTSIVQVPLFWISQRLSKPGVREEKFSSICVVTSFTKRAVVSHIEFYFTAVTTRFISKYIKIYHCLWMAIVLILLYITQMTNNWFASPVNLENTSVSVTYRVRQEKSTKKWKCSSAARTWEDDGLSHNSSLFWLERKSFGWKWM